MKAEGRIFIINFRHRLLTGLPLVLQCCLHVSKVGLRVNTCHVEQGQHLFRV